MKPLKHVLFCLIVLILSCTIRGNTNAKLMTVYPHGFEAYRAESTEDGCFWITNQKSQFTIANLKLLGQWSKIKKLPVANGRISANSCSSAITSSFAEAFLTTDGGDSWSPIQLPKGLAEQGLVDIKYVGNKFFLSGASWISLPKGTSELFPHQYSTNSRVYKSTLYFSEDLGKHWNNASVIGLDLPLGGMKLSILNKDSIFFYAEGALYRLDFKHSALSLIQPFSQCHSKQPSFAISNFISGESTCSNMQECFIPNLDELLVRSNSEDEQQCIFQDLFRSNAPATGLKQLVVWGPNLFFLDRSGGLWYKALTSENPIAINSPKVAQIVLTNKRLFVFSEVGILEILLH